MLMLVVSSPFVPEAGSWTRGLRFLGTMLVTTEWVVSLTLVILKDCLPLGLYHPGVNPWLGHSPAPSCLPFFLSCALWTSQLSQIVSSGLPTSAGITTPCQAHELGCPEDSRDCGHQGAECIFAECGGMRRCSSCLLPPASCPATQTTLSSCKSWAWCWVFRVVCSLHVVYCCPPVHFTTFSHNNLPFLSGQPQRVQLSWSPILPEWSLAGPFS